MPPGKQYSRAKRWNRRYSPALRSYHSFSSEYSGRSNSENSDAVSYNSGSEYSSRSWTPRGLRREPRRRRGRGRHSRPRSHVRRSSSSSLSRSEPEADVRRGSGNCTRRIRGRRYRSRSWSDFSSTSSSTSAPETPCRKNRQRHTSRHRRTRRGENTDSTQRFDNMNHLSRDKPIKKHPTAISDTTTRERMQAMPQKASNPPALPPSTTAVPSSSVAQMGISSSTVPREPLSPLPIYALDSILKESTPARVEVMKPAETSNLPRHMLEDEQAYEQWLRGGRVRTPTCSTRLHTPSRIDTAVTPASGNLKPTSDASPMTSGTSIITTNWTNVELETPFFVMTDMNTLQNAPGLISKPNRDGEVAPTVGPPHSDGEREVENTPLISTNELGGETKIVNFDELEGSFKQSFMTGKVHPKPPWFLCALEKDCREHPYYIQWLDTLELSPSLEEQLNQSRMRVSKIVANGGKS